MDDVEDEEYLRKGYRGVILDVLLSENGGDVYAKDPVCIATSSDC